MHEPGPVISVITVCYNSAATLERTLHFSALSDSLTISLILPSIVKMCPDTHENQHYHSGIQRRP